MPPLAVIAATLLLLSSTRPSSAASDAKSLLECERLSLALAVKPAVAVTVAKQLRKCLDLTLDSAVADRLLSLKDVLPASVRNAVFLPTVCVKNKRFPEYMYVPLGGFKYDGERRRVFTFVGADWDHAKGDFRLVPTTGKYFFVVSTNHDECLVATGDDEVVDYRRRVVAWEPDWDAVNKTLAQWELEPVAGDTAGRVYIRNRQFGEYLYAVDGLNYDKERRMVATWAKKDNGCRKDAQCVWEIKAC